MVVREYPTSMGVGFLTGDVVPDYFLNQLDDLVYSYGDSILPTHTATQVYVQATAGDEAQITLGRRFFINDSDTYVPVSGPADTYHLYGAASYVPTNHSSQVKPFDLVVGTTPPSGYEYVKHLATVEWSGSQIQTVFQDPHRLNAAQLDGYLQSQDPADGAVVPVASSNGKLHHEFRPRFPGVDAELGEVVDFWSPPGSPWAIHPAWALCDGSIIPSGSHDLGAFPLQLPDLRDRLVVGASPTRTYAAAATPSNLASSAPGIGGVKTAHLSDAVLSHAHTMPAHTHLASHRHAMTTHDHTFQNHTHGLRQLNWQREYDESFPIHYYADADTTQTGGARMGNAAAGVVTTVNDVGGGRPDWIPSPSPESPEPNFVGVTAPGTDSVAGPTVTTSPTTEARPRFYGFARIMKVRD